MPTALCQLGLHIQAFCSSNTSVCTYSYVYSVFGVYGGVPDGTAAVTHIRSKYVSRILRISSYLQVFARILAPCDQYERDGTRLLHLRVMFGMLWTQGGVAARVSGGGTGAAPSSLAAGLAISDQSQPLPRPTYRELGPRPALPEPRGWLLLGL